MNRWRSRYILASWPLISPFGFLAVWTLTYSLWCASALFIALVKVALPCAPLLHGPHSGIRTLPALPMAPMWMWAAVAFPVRPENVSFQVSFLPTILPVNRPFALLSFTTWAGTSCLAFSFAWTLIVLVRAANASAATANEAATATASPATSFFTAPPSWVSIDHSPARTDRIETAA